MRAMLMVLVLAAPAAAEESDWTMMSGKDIEMVLTGATVDYSNAWQDFRASGRTLYNAGSDSWGYWGVRGDQYCSMWPPSDLWACYDMAQKDGMVRFVGEAGDVTDGIIRAAGD